MRGARIPIGQIVLRQAVRISWGSMTTVYDPLVAQRPIPEAGRVVSDLVDRLVARDADAFEELVRTRSPRMLAVAIRYLPRRQDAEDALQEAFLNVVRSISGFKGACSLDTWLHRIVVNCALMLLRGRRRKPEITHAESVFETERTGPWRRWPPPSAHDVVANRELKSIVQQAVARLPEIYRVVLLLRDVEALDLKQISELLGVGVPTVKSRLRRARNALQCALGPQLSESST